MNVPLAAVDYIEPWWMVVIKCLVLAFIGLQLVPLVLLAERKILGRFQNRYGPNRVGIYGVGTPIADIITLVNKIGDASSFGEFNIPLEMEIRQHVHKPGIKAPLVGRCSITFHCTPKAMIKAKLERRRKSVPG
jgi:hypothetical protein